MVEALKQAWCPVFKEALIEEALPQVLEDALLEALKQGIPFLLSEED